MQMDEKHDVVNLLNELYPLDIYSVEQVTKGIWRCNTKQGVVYARISNYKTYDEQLEEVKWINFLQEHGVGVAPAIASSSNKLVEKIELREVKNTVLFKAAPGIHLPKSQWNENILRKLGREIGRMHRVSKQYEEMYSINYIPDWDKSGEYDFLKHIPIEESIIREIANNVVNTIKQLPKSDMSYGLIHGDLWRENILVDDNFKISMIDFQDCEKHYFIYDLAVPIYSAIEYSFIGKGNITDYGNSITSALIEGYREEHEILPEILDQLPLFIKLKEIFDYSLIHRYWDQEKLSEEQFRIMNHLRIRIEHNHSIIKHI